MPKEKEALDQNKLATVTQIYGSQDDYDYHMKQLELINADLELREQPSMVFNGVPYSQGYLYNQRKAINYAPPRNPKDDRQVSLGMVHEKIVAFAAIFLKYVFRRRIKCYDDNGVQVKGMGDIYDLAIEFSHKMENFKAKIALIYWEVFTQGNAFVLEDWEVKIQETPKAYTIAENGERKLVTPDNMDYTYEFLDSLTYEKGEQAQYRRAVSKILDGRRIIFGDPEIAELQEQPRITLEEEITAADAEAIFGTLKRWKYVPKTRESFEELITDRMTLFDSKRMKDPADVFIVHRYFNKENNRFNIYLNGVAMLPRETPMTLFYPRGNYPISNVPAERLTNSIYSRSIPAKTKFNADFVDWALKMLAQKFEQGIEPAILSRGKYTLTRDMFRGGQVTHGISKDDFEKADPDNKGITQSEFSFTQLLKEIIETQSLNTTTSGELSSNATATEISVVENNQRDKLGFLLDGLMTGFMDMAHRRAETIESKYTIKQKETIVDGKKINVYQNFAINVSGIENVVFFSDEVGNPDYDEEGMRDFLFEAAHNDRKDGNPTKYYLANPDVIRQKRYNLDIEILPERVKDTQLQMIQMWDEFTQLINLFGRSSQGGMVDMEEIKKEYLEVSGKPDKIFTSEAYRKLEEAEAGQAAYNQGQYGQPQGGQPPEATAKVSIPMKPNIKEAVRNQ